jgi:hypothetical protein
MYNEWMRQDAIERAYNESVTTALKALGAGAGLAWLAYMGTKA